MANDQDPLTREIIAAAIEVHRELGPGLLESACEESLCYELSLHGIEFLRQNPMPVTYKAVRLDCGYKLDILLPGKLVLELKAVEKMIPLYEAQLLTYLKLSKIHRGLLINFNVPLLKDGVTRMVWGHRQE